MILKKIFFIADAKSIHTVKWIDYFVDRNYEVHLATFAKVNNTKCSNIYFLTDKEPNVRGGNFHYFFAIKKLATIFKRVNPNIINAHYSYSMGLIALIAKKISKVDSTFSVVCHGSDVLDTPIPLVYDRLNRYVLARADKVFAVSDQIKDRLVEWKIEEDKIFVGQYGVEAQTLIQAKRDIDILSNRTYCSNSRIEFLLESLLSFKDKNLNIVFVLPTIDEKNYELLKKRYSFVTFYKSLEYETMIKFLQRTKLYISATKSDGTSLSLLEALSYGSIPLISNIVSNRSWVLDGMNGFLFNNKSEFQSKLDFMLNSSNLEEMKVLNKKIMLERGDYKINMKKIEEFIQ